MSALDKRWLSICYERVNDHFHSISKNFSEQFNRAVNQTDWSIVTNFMRLRDLRYQSYEGGVAVLWKPIIGMKLLNKLYISFFIIRKYFLMNPILIPLGPGALLGFISLRQNSISYDEKIASNYWNWSLPSEGKKGSPAWVKVLCPPSERNLQNETKILL